MTAILVWSGLAVATLGHGFLWTGIVNRIHGLSGPRRFIKALTWGSILAFCILPSLIAWECCRSMDVAFNPFARRDWVACYVWLAFAIGVVAVLVKLWVEAHRYDRSVLQKWTADVRDVAKLIGRKPLAGPVALVLGNLPLNEALQLSVDRKRLALPRLPEELEGLTIAHITDLHMTGRLEREFYEVVSRQLNDLRPDVIAITGDIVEKTECLPWLEKSLGVLCAPLGVYYILGNHDAFIDARHTRELLTGYGLTCLSGRWQKAEWNGIPVVLGGNELPWMSAADVARLGPRQPDRHEFRLVFCHTPDQFAWCVRADADLALAGHTHGGQVQIPILGPIGSPSLHGTRYACGVFRRGDTVLHVSRGVAGETPLRWRCPPEIALLELTRQRPDVTKS
jgi:predicted MPP superfamily phosphohydrolase/heme exporter protein D